MTDIAPYLERLGLEQYFDAFIGEGFDSWETLLDIQETDLYVFESTPRKHCVLTWA
jgi:hypothetical protein